MQLHSCRLRMRRRPANASLNRRVVGLPIAAVVTRWRRLISLRCTPSSPIPCQCRICPITLPHHRRSKASCPRKASTEPGRTNLATSGHATSVATRRPLVTSKISLHANCASDTTRNAPSSNLPRNGDDRMRICLRAATAKAMA